MLTSIKPLSEILGRERRLKHTLLHVTHMLTTSRAVTIGLGHCLCYPQPIIQNNKDKANSIYCYAQLI